MDEKLIIKANTICNKLGFKKIKYGLFRFDNSFERN